MSNPQVNTNSTQVRFLSLPPEVMLKIFEELPSDGETIKSLRLASKRLNALATPRLFHTIALPFRLEGLKAASEVLGKDSIGRHIRDLHVQLTSLVPEEMLEEDCGCLIGDCFTRPHDRFVPRWSSLFGISMFRIISASSKGLRKLRMDGYQKELYCNFPKFLEEVYIRCITDILCIVNLPCLHELIVSLRDADRLRPLYEEFRSETNTFQRTINSKFPRNIRGIQRFALEGTEERPSDIGTATHKKDMEKLLTFLAKLSLNAMTLSHANHPGDALLAPMQSLSQFHSLKELKLEFLIVTDSLSAPLQSLHLRRLKLRQIALFENSDRWEYIFNVIQATSDLASLSLESLEYVERSSENELIGSPSTFWEDKEGFSKLCDVYKAREGNFHAFFEWDDDASQF